MNENLKVLLKNLGEDEELQTAYHAATAGKEDEDYVDAIVAFANEHGYKLGIGDLQAANGTDLQDDELSTVAGGLEFNCKGNYLGPKPDLGLGASDTGTPGFQGDRLM